ncbi:Isochorismatase-like protein [Radiomyces spectabilis]|uniref:Isochorismatase-like protein n=1 Tax=Radiomyces spectabilis TaxID=64574 RepID=UPI002220D314|nr:Isochorismatase-like protein [Radiomyces spectabilis]KAI8369337.1 Isochorismatase-like protein [Radiomyces spectabilis]
MMENTALLLIDIQHDFLEEGSLAVPHASEIFPAVNRLIQAVKDKGGLIVASQDWHPQDHVSFGSNHAGNKPFETITIQYENEAISQTLWPDHCVQGTYGATISEKISISDISHVVKKGTNRMVDSYSAFADNKYFEITELAKLLYQKKIETVIVVGLAADYCVKLTCLDAIKFGFKTILVKEGTRAVFPEAFNATMDELRSKGVSVASIDDDAFANVYLSP